MLLEPGPWLPLVLNDTLPPAEPSILHDNAVAATAEIDNSDAITDQYYQIMTDAIGNGGEIEADADAQSAAWGLDFEQSVPFDPGLDQALYYQPQLDADTVQAEREIPPEAYLPIPDELTDYDARQTFTLDGSQQQPDDTGGGPQQPIITYDATVTLTNLNRPGSPNFNVGESFRLDVHGPPGQAVRVESSRNSDTYPSTGYGYTDAAGDFSLVGVQDVTSQGYWREKWFVGETVCYPVLNFAVN